MSNAAFDSLVRSQEIKSAKEMIKSMEAAEAAGEGTDFTARAIPAQRERLEALLARNY